MTETTTREHTATLRTLVQYAGASGDFYEMHYDLPFAQALGHPDLSVHGLLKAAWLGNLVEEWFGPRAQLLTLEVRYRGMDFRDRPVTCGATVVARSGDVVDLELWTRNDDGETTTVGTAQVRDDDRSPR